MFKLSLENKFGEKLTLTQRESEYQVIEVQGLTPPNASITSSNVIDMDGAAFVSSRLEVRNIVIYVRVNGNVEENRIKLYKYAKAKQYCKIYYKSNTRDIFAEGYVETYEGTQFTNNQVMQISIVCHNPYLQSIDEIQSDVSKLIGLFKFPFSFGAGGVVENTITDPAIAFGEYDDDRMVNIVNEGADTGLLMRFRINGGDVTNLVIYNVTTRDFFALDTTFKDLDVVEINTNRGSKSVTLTRNGLTTNIINTMRIGSKWLQLYAGDNVFTYAVDTGKQYISAYFNHRTQYDGV